MSIETNKVLVRRYLEAWGEGDTGTMMNLLNSNAAAHNLATGKKLGVEFEKKACEIWHSAFADSTLTIDKLIAEGDQVAAYWTLTGKHTGEFVGIAPTSKEIHVSGMEINRVVDGEIVEIWRLSDTMSLMQQLDAVPSP